jgi:1-acyl-sn-glycerol-3-phosphate acyltransferase
VVGESKSGATLVGTPRDNALLGLKPVRASRVGARRRHAATHGAARVVTPRVSRRRVVKADEFGLDEEFLGQALPLFRLLYEKYWRVEARGVRHVPRSGPTILVANHSGAIPFDATMIACALDEAHHPRPTRFLYDRFVEDLPWIPQLYRRAGGVVASHANAQRLLEKGELVGLFPEGVPGLAKLYSERYVLQPFSTGFVRLALRYRAAIVPVAVVGAEEIYPLVGRMRGVGKLLGIPYLPVTPFFPVLGPLGMIPLPTKWIIRFGRPIILDVPGGQRHDGATVRAAAERLRRCVQQMVRGLLRERDGIF